MQWNAQSLTQEKAVELTHLAKQRAIDFVCLSECGKRRQIQGFRVCAESSTDTQSAIFCRNGIKTQDISAKFEPNIPRIQIQCVDIEEDATLIHLYIAPDATHRTRKQIWDKIVDLHLQ
jgi:hypothetical protein